MCALGQAAYAICVVSFRVRVCGGFVLFFIFLSVLPRKGKKGSNKKRIRKKKKGRRGEERKQKEEGRKKNEARSHKRDVSTIPTFKYGFW